MPRFPILPPLGRAAAIALAAASLSASTASLASAAVLSPSAPLASSIPTANTSSSTSTNAPSWNGDLSTNTFSQYAHLWSCPGGVSLTSNPTYGGQPSAAFTVNDNFTMSSCPGHVFTPNPASSLLSPGLFTNGTDAYVSFATMFPVGFPRITNWFQFAEFDGPPYGGSPTVGFDVSGTNLGLWRDATHHFDNPWHAPIQYGKWENIVAHVKFSTNPQVGFVEIWLNGVQQHFTNGSTRLYYDTMLFGDNWDGHSSNFLNLNQYRGLFPSLGSVTIYHAAAKAGSSLAAVSS